MHVTYPFFLLLAFLGALWLIYRITRFDYSLNSSHITIIWWFLGLIPLKKKIRIEKIERLFLEKDFSLWRVLWTNSTVWAKPQKSMVVIQLKRPSAKRIFISPYTPDAFIDDFNKKFPGSPTKKND